MGSEVDAVEMWGGRRLLKGGHASGLGPIRLIEDKPSWRLPRNHHGATFRVAAQGPKLSALMPTSGKPPTDSS